MCLSRHGSPARATSVALLIDSAVILAQHSVIPATSASLAKIAAVRGEKNRAMAIAPARKLSTGAGPGEGVTGMWRGAKEGLRSVQGERLRRRPMGVNQRFDDRLDGPDCQGSDQTVRFFPRPCDERAQTRVLHPIRCPR